MIDETGRITGYKTSAGADTVFPFSSSTIDLALYCGGRASAMTTVSYLGGFQITSNAGKVLKKIEVISGTVYGNLDADSFTNNIELTQGKSLELNENSNSVQIYVGRPEFGSGDWGGVPQAIIRLYLR